MRKLLQWILIVGLIAGQPAGFVHALSHLDVAAIQSAHRVSSVELHRDSQPAASDFCEECLAFAQLAAAAPAPPIAPLPNVAAVPNEGADAIPRVVPVPLSASLARGPPTA